MTQTESIKVYRLFKHGTPIAEGTIEELARLTGLAEATLRSHRSTPSRSKRIRLRYVGLRKK